MTLEKRIKLRVTIDHLWQGEWRLHFRYRSSDISLSI
ncbi:MAG: hypothetical protein ACI9TK_000538 [Flavobacteriaceae bacterium]|jgi:hypothetical protein